MTSYSISEAKNQLSALLAKVKRGARIVITDRGVPVAVLGPVTPVEAPMEADEARLARLEREGLIRRGSGRAVPLDDPVRLPAGVSAVAALLAEREEGR